MSTLLERHRGNDIDPAGLACLLAELPPAPFAAQARAHRQMQRAGAVLDAPLVRQLIRVGRGPAGGSTLGAATGGTFRNTPGEGFRIAPEIFEEATVPNVWSSSTKTDPGWASKDGFDIPNRGLLAQIELITAGTFTHTAGTGTITATDYLPYGWFDSIEFSVNGSALKSASGLAYELRRQVLSRRATTTDLYPTAAGANTWNVRHRIPIADNMRNLWGAILAQADDLYLRLDLTRCAKAKIVALTGNADVTWAGTWQLRYKAFDVPIVNIQGIGEVAVLPDTDVLHRFHEYSVPVTSNGDTVLKLQRTAGEVERVFLFLENGGASAYALQNPNTWEEVRFRYMANEQPLVWPAKSLLAENANDYSGVLSPKAVVIDFAAHNQRRDGLFPKAIADPEIVVNVPTAVTVNANARLYAVQESLVGGA